MDFAPYQDTNPETTRALSPPLPFRRSHSFTPSPRIPPLSSPRIQAPSPSSYQNDRTASPYQDRWPTTDDTHGSLERVTDIEAGYFGNIGGQRRALDDFATSLGMGMDYEACLAYLVFPPAGAIFLLIVERKSDFVRCVS